MRSLITFATLAMMAGQALAIPIDAHGLQTRFDAIQSRDFYDVPIIKRSPRKTHVSTGNAGSANGGSVTQQAGTGGTITNHDGSALGGKGGSSMSGTPTPEEGSNSDVSSGSSGNVDGGSVRNSGGSITNTGGSSIGGAGGTSTTADADARD
ncbi:hypothetical protein BC835DRAFT_875195 [Cytidiella melzeri]|nr:hypothetical protein BC835DRAFT_875195 [Cytidiella melzeri]